MKILADELKNAEAQRANAQSPSHIDRKRKANVEWRFFDPKRTKKPATVELAKQLISNRLVQKKEELSKVEVKGVPARRIMTAERSLQQVGIEIFGWPDDAFKAELGYYPNPSTERTQKYDSGTFTTRYSNIETLQMGDDENASISYVQRTQPHTKRLGDCLAYELGRYSDILANFNKITGALPEKEQELARLMQRFSAKGEAIMLPELKAINEDAEEADVKKINRICFLLLIKEPSQWMHVQNEEDLLPLATAQARALKLIIAGYLRFSEVFSQDAPYGVFTGTNLVKDIQGKIIEKINRIDALYQQYLRVAFDKNYIEFFKKQTSTWHSNFDPSHSSFIASQQQIRQDLRDVYGGDSDSDGEGYEADEERLIKSLQLMLDKHCI